MKTFARRHLRTIAGVLGVAVVAVAPGWPWGPVAAAGCVLIPVAVMAAIGRAMGVHLPRPAVRRPLRVNSVRLEPESRPAARKVIAGKAEHVSTRPLPRASK